MPDPKAYGIDPGDLATKLTKQLVRPGERFLPIHSENLIRDVVHRKEGASVLSINELAYLVDVAVHALIEKGRQ